MPALGQTAGHDLESSSTLLPALSHERCPQPSTTLPRSLSPDLGVAALVVKHCPWAGTL